MSKRSPALVLYLNLHDCNLQIAECHQCQKTGRKISKVAPPLHCVPVVSPWHHIGIDFIGPISPPSTQGSQYILTVGDYFTKFVEAIPTPTKHAEGVASNLFKVWSYNHVQCMIPLTLISFSVAVYENRNPQSDHKRPGE